MRLINTVSIALTLAAASSLAAPSSTKCGYESDKVHLSCIDAEHYARDVEVTYDMTKRSHVEQFLRRSDAIQALTRGMDEDSQLQERADVVGQGNNVGNYCNFGNGNVNGRRANNAQFNCDQQGKPIYGPHPTPQVIGAENLRRDSQGDVNVNAAPGVNVYETNTGVNTNKGEGNNVGRVMNFGMGRRDEIQGSGVHGDGNAVQNHCVYSNNGKSKRDNAASQMTCTQHDSPIYGPNGGSVTIIGARSFSFNDIDDVVDYHVARSFLPHARPFIARDEVCSGTPVGPVGAQVTYVTRGLPTEPTPALPLNNVARSINTPSATKPEKRCINTPIAPVAPTVSYISKADYKKEHGQ